MTVYRRVTPEWATPAEWTIIRALMEREFYTFVRLVFRFVFGRQWVEAPFQRVVCDVLEKVFRGEVKRLIINIPPRYGKTWLIVILWISWCLAKAPWSRFLHTSYSDELVLLNSRYIKDLIQSEIYQLLWPQKLRDDSTAKKAWTLARDGGGLNTAPVGGQLTGFGAGVTGVPEFSGARIIDDPTKLQDATRAVIRERTNNWYPDTFVSRKESRDVPTILVMQRTHEEDMTWFLAATGVDGVWHHLIIPTPIEATDSYPVEFESGIPIDHGLPLGPIWPYKHTADELADMAANPVTKYVYATQYKQVPVLRGGGMVQAGWLVDYNQYDARNSCVDGHAVVRKRIYADTAQKVKEINDYSVFLCAALLDNDCVAIIDMVRGKFEAPERVTQFKRFVRRHAFNVGVVNTGINAIKVEDKSSGTELIQTINNDVEFISETGGVRVGGIPRNTDKVSRMTGVAPHIEAGKLWIPRRTLWRSEFIKELTSFNKYNTQAHDDITDTVMDAIDDLIIRGSAGVLDYGRLRHL